ncbi:polyketide synthase dehydratase domain-containing protein, partial [Streptomyces sp. NBC_00199]
SNVTGAPATQGQLTDPGYWAGHIRAAVRFHDGVQALHARGITAYLELGPDPVLTALVKNTLDTHTDTDTDAEGSSGVATAVAVLRRDKDEARTALGALAVLHAHGIGADLTPLLGAGRRIALPTYAFQHEDFWLHAAPRTDVTSAGLNRADHPLLGAAVELADTGHLVLTGRLTPHDQPWLADHTIAGTTLLPGTAFLDLALHAARLTGLGAVEDVVLEAPLALPSLGAVRLQVTVEAPDGSGARALSVHSRPEAGEGAEDTDPATWTRHATGTLTPTPAPAPAPEPAPAVWPPAHATPVDLTGLYPRLTAQGYAYGPAFQGLTHLWHHADDYYARITLPHTPPPTTTPCTPHSSTPPSTPSSPPPQTPAQTQTPPPTQTPTQMRGSASPSPGTTSPSTPPTPPPSTPTSPEPPPTPSASPPPTPPDNPSSPSGNSPPGRSPVSSSPRPGPPPPRPPGCICRRGRRSPRAGPGSRWRSGWSGWSGAIRWVWPRRCGRRPGTRRPSGSTTRSARCGRRWTRARAFRRACWSPVSAARRTRRCWTPCGPFWGG